MTGNSEIIGENDKTAGPKAKFFDRIKSFCQQGHKDQPHLLSYAPTRDSAHDIYAKELLHCIKDKSMKNIAVTGANGSGKSSAIEQLKLSVPKWRPSWQLSQRSIKTVSFLSIDGGAKDAIAKNVENMAKDVELFQKKETGGEPSGPTNTGDEIAAREKTRQAIQWEETRQAIQWEIVKQLFFSTNPNKTPKSRYFRIDRTEHFWLTLIVSASAAVIIGIILETILSAQGAYMALREIITAVELHNGFIAWLIRGFQNFFYNGQPFSIEDHVALHHTLSILTLSLLSFATIFLTLRFCQRHPLKSFKLKDISLDLRDKIPDFEQTSDELIYLFRKAKIRVVVLEDIDRFDNLLIYEDLRQLNNLLNNAVKHKVTFIYALKADLIAKIEDRAKLFDVTMPITPVITSDNALGLIKHEFEKVGFQDNSISKIIRIISNNVHDMRSIKAICNGAFMLNRLIQSNNNVGEKLRNPEEIVAIATIRELYPAEYQNLCSNTSDSTVDNIFRECQAIKDEKITTAESNLNKVQHLSELLDKYGNSVWKQLNVARSSKNDARVIAITMDGKTIGREDVTKIDFIEKLIAGSTLQVTEEYTEGYYGKKNIEMEYDLSSLRNIMPKEYMELIDVSKLPEEVYEEQKARASEEDPFVEYGGLPADRRTELPQNMTRVIGAMISEGILDQNYRLYIAPFSNHDGRSIKLINFCVNYLQKNIPNYRYRLSDEDIETLLCDYKYYLETPVFYNYSIISHIIETNSNDLDTVLFPKKENFQSLIEFLLQWLNDRQGEIAQLLLLNHIAIDDYDTEPALVFLSKMAQKHFSETLTAFVRTSSINQPEVKDFMLAIILLSAPDFHKDIEFVKGIDADILQTLDKNSQDLIKHSNVGDILAEIFRINSYKIENLFVFAPDSREVMDLVQTNSFRIAPKNLQWLHENNFDDVMKSYDLSKGDLQILLKLQTAIPDSIWRLIISNVEHYYQAIANDAQLAAWLGEALVKNKIEMSQSNLQYLAGTVPDDIMVKIILINKAVCNVEVLRWIFGKMSNPYCKLARPRSRPLLPDDEDGRALIKILKKLNMIYPPKPVNSTRLIVRDFETAIQDKQQ